MKGSTDKKKGNPKGDKKQGESKSGSKRFKPKKKELKFMPLDMKSQVAQTSYNTVKEALITKIAATFNKGHQDVMISLEDKVKVVSVVPTLGVSNKTGNEQKREDNKFVYIYRDKIKHYNDRIDVLEDGLVRAYGLIWSKYMSTLMMNHIGQHPEYATVIKNNPIEVLKSIRASMHETVRAQKPLLTATSALLKLLTYKQQDDTSMSEYIKTFKEL
jgi:hypothetical protein